MNVQVDWDTNPEANISHYRVYYGPTAAFGTVVNSNTNSLLLSGLPDGKDIYIGISAVNDQGEESAVSTPQTVINKYVYIGM